MAGRQVLAALGRADVILSGQPEITFFLEQYKAQGLFASRVIRVSFENEPVYGSDNTVEIPMNGDLITAMYARFDVTFPPGTAMFDSAGNLMIERVELYSGNDLIERLWGEFMTLTNDCEISAGQQPGLVSIVGGTALAGANAPLNRYTVPLGFKCLRKGLPVVPGLKFRIILNPSSVFQSTGAGTPNLSFKFLSEFVFLSESERTMIQNRGPVIHLSESVQRARFLAPVGSSNIRCVTEFLHPVKELFMTIQNQGTGGTDYTPSQLQSMAMYFNEAQRLDPVIGTYLFLGSQQFLEYHTRVPSRPFYMYSFSLDPEGATPSGAVNFGRIKNQYFDFFMNPGTSARVVTIWARYYQFLEVNGFKTLRVLFDNTGENGTSAILS